MRWLLMLGLVACGGKEEDSDTDVESNNDDPCASGPASVELGRTNNGTFSPLEDGDTIDITDAPRRDIIRHNYHYFNSKIAEDMRLLLAEGKRAAERPV